MRSHGNMSMAPANGGGGGGAAPAQRSPSGTGHPAVPPAPSSPGDGRGDDTGSAPVMVPMPVVLTWGTILKFAAAIVVPLLAGTSFAIYFFHKTNIHMEDPTVHLTRGERGKLETKTEAASARKKLEKSITKEFGLRTREIKLDLSKQQRVQFKKLGKELKLEQKTQLVKILREVKRARRDIRNR